MALPAWMQENQKSSEKPTKFPRDVCPQGHTDKFCFLPVNGVMFLKVICDSFSFTLTGKQEGRKAEERGRVHSSNMEV